MHLTRSQQKKGMVLTFPSRAELLSGVRKQAVPPSKAFRDKRNDYRRKPKHQENFREVEN